MSQVLGVVYLPPAEGSAPDAGPPVPASQRRFGSRSLLEWVVRRVGDAESIGQVVVLPADGCGQVLPGLPPDVPCVPGGPGCCSQRLAAALATAGCSAAVVVEISNPYIDPELLDQLVHAARQHDLEYACFGSRRERRLSGPRPAHLAQWCTLAALRKSARPAAQPPAAQPPVAESPSAGPPEELGALDPAALDPAAPLRAAPSRFRTRWLPLPAALDRADVRLDLIVEEDWEHADTIYEALGSEDFGWQQVSGLLDRQPAIRARMAQLNGTVPVGD